MKGTNNGKRRRLEAHAKKRDNAIVTQILEQGEAFQDALGKPYTMKIMKYVKRTPMGREVGTPYMEPRFMVVKGARVEER